MSAYTKTAGTSLLAWQDIATANVVVGSAADVATKLAATIFALVGRNPAAGAFTAGWPNVRVEASAKASGNDAWVPLIQWQPAVGASLANTTLNGAVSAGATTVTVTSASNIAAGDVLFLGDSSTSNYELVRVKSVSGTTVTLEEACTYNHANGAVVTDQAEMYCGSIDLAGITRIRAVADNANSGRTVSVQVLMVTGDSIG